MYICIDTIHIPKGYYGKKKKQENWFWPFKKCVICKILRGFLLSSFETFNTLSSFLLLGSID